MYIYLFIYFVYLFSFTFYILFVYFPFLFFSFCFFILIYLFILCFCSYYLLLGYSKEFLLSKNWHFRHGFAYLSLTFGICLLGFVLEASVYYIMCKSIVALVDYYSENW